MQWVAGDIAEEPGQRRNGSFEILDDRRPFHVKIAGKAMPGVAAAGAPRAMSSAVALPGANKARER
ncbi:hypothetical protein SAMN04488012_1069 [Palleronia salina]|uniref:Uncharacterized protein n=1 Tax=Palleronia salina TaxID=313368 RepID=A0A1M6HGD9_9RHOB|nr:hypothetical protein SAMN04488012_1069 [Palleronia salina]